MGDLHVIKFSPDSGNIMIVGGEKEEMVRTFDLQKFENVIDAFQSNEDVQAKMEY